MNPSEVLKKAYLLDIEDASRLIFDYVPPEISTSKAANWSPTQIIGRSESLMGYGSSENTTINMELQFIVSKTDGDVGQHKTDAPMYEDLMAKIRWLRSFAYPDYGPGAAASATAKPPHRAYLRIGKLIGSFVLIQNVDVTYRGPWSEDLLPTIVVVSMPMTVINPKPPGTYQIRAKADFYSGG